MDAEGRVTQAGDSFTDLLGHEPEELAVGPAWWTEGGGEPRGASLASVIADVVDGGGGRFTTQLRDRSGRRLWVEVDLGRPVSDVSGSGPTVTRGAPGDQLLGVIRDVTGVRWSHQRLRVLAESGRMLVGAEDLSERLRAVADSASRAVRSGVAITVMRPDGRRLTFVTSNPDDERGAGLPEYGELDRQELLNQVADTSDGEVVALHGLGVAGTPESVAPWGSALVAPMSSEASRIGSVVVFAPESDRVWPEELRDLIRDLAYRVCSVVKADRAAEREHRLHDASAALAAAETVPEAAEALAEALRHALGASGVAVYTRPADDPAHLLLAHVTGQGDRFAEHFGRIPVTARCLTGEVARVGRARWLSEDVVHQRPFPIVDEIGGDDPVEAAISLPLRLDDRVTGVVTATFPVPREFAAAERSFTHTLVAQAAHVLDRAAAADARAEIARTLQHALLPRRLPRLPRLGLASHYEPAGRHTNAGGDWYDVIALGGSRVALVVGDVTGSGATAAAVMGQLRAALAGFLLEGHSCSRALTLLERLARRIDGATASTVACMVLDVETGELRWARAGHVPALLLDPSEQVPSARWLDGVGGAALNVLPPTGRGQQGPAGSDGDPGPRFGEGRLIMPPGASVLLFTDGLVERRGEIIDVGLARLADTAVAHADSAPPALLDALLSGVLDDAVADDVALVVARLRPPALRARLPAVPDQLRESRVRIRSWARETGLTAEAVDDLQLTVGEAAANAIEHAYGADEGGSDDRHFHLELALTDRGDVAARVADHGDWRPEPEDRGFRGRGLELIKALGEDVSITTGDGTEVAFVLPVTGGRDVEAPAGGRAPDDPGTVDVDVDAGGSARLHLRGDFDVANVGPARDELEHLVDRHGGAIEIDAAEVTYLPSSGIRMLVDAVNSEPDRITLWVRANTLPQRVLDLVGLPYQVHGE